MGAKHKVSYQADTSPNWQASYWELYQILLQQQSSLNPVEQIFYTRKTQVSTGLGMKLFTLLSVIIAITITK
jgi:hypothetical protein